jgi:hypothetical protein
VVAIPEQLLAEIVAESSLDAYLVVADHLTAHGDSRGELIIAAHCLLARPDDTALRAHVDALLTRERASFDDAVNFESPSEATTASTWHLGFVRTLRLERATPERVRAALSHQSACLLERLELWLELPDDNAAHVVFEQPRAALRSLAIHRSGRSSCGHDASPPWSMLPNLAELRIEGAHVVHDIAHPTIERLRLSGASLCEPTWRLPRLHTLTWQHPPLDAFVRLCRAAPPALRELDLYCDPRGDLRARLRELVRELPPVKVLLREPVSYRYLRRR